MKTFSLCLPQETLSNRYVQNVCFIFLLKQIVIFIIPTLSLLLVFLLIAYLVRLFRKNFIMCTYLKIAKSPIIFNIIIIIIGKVILGVPSEQPSTNGMIKVSRIDVCACRAQLPLDLNGKIQRDKSAYRRSGLTFSVLFLFFFLFYRSIRI